MFHKNFAAAIRVGSRFLCEKNGSVYMPFGSEYSVRLRNYNTRKAVVEITIDGKTISPGSRFIVPANGSVDIERFLEGNDQEGHRFKFVKMTDRIREHRGETMDDGVVRVEYWFEQEPVQWLTTTTATWTPYPNAWTYTDFTGGDFTHITGGPYLNSRCSSIKEMSLGGNYGAQNVSCFVHDSHQVDESGITVNGGLSNQQFHTATIGQLEPTSHVIVLKLTGDIGNSVVVRPVTRQTKAHCSVCGTSNPYLNEYCGHCGNCLH